MQGMLTRLGWQGRHGRPVSHWYAKEGFGTLRMDRQREQDQHGHDRDMLIHGPRGLVSAHHVAGLLAGYRVSQERGGISQAVTNAVIIAPVAAFVSGGWRGADGAGDMSLPYWVAEVSACPGNQNRGQSRRSLLVEHAYADTSLRSSSPADSRSSMR
jgi:hypothetical protein